VNTREIRHEAKRRLKGSWGLGNGAYWLAIILPLIPIYFITPLFGAIFGIMVELGLDWLIRIFFAAPLLVGLRWVFLRVIDGENRGIGNLFEGFTNYWGAVGVSFMTNLFMTLWSLIPVIPAIIIGALVIVLAVAIESGLLFVGGFFIIMLPSTIVGIWARLRYAQAIFILKDEPEIGVMAAIKKSKQMMRGNLWSLFKLELFFWVWHLPLLIFVILFIGLFSTILIPFFEAIGSYVHSPWMMQAALSNLVDETFLLGVGAVAIGLVLSALYSIGISFYLVPYQYASEAMFYRTLNPKIKRSDEFSQEESFEFFSNSPRPIDASFTDEERSEYGLRD